MESTASAPGPGWYPDPNDPTTNRYWDGAKWTDSRAPRAATTQSKTSGMAIASLVLGLVWAYGIGSILAIVFGFIAKKNIREAGGMETGGGMATAGIVLGIIGVVAVVIIIIAAVTVDSNSDYYY